MCQVIGADNTLAKDSTGTVIVKPCVDTSDAGLTPADVRSCLYRVKGWLKIRQLKEEGWVRMSGRITGTSIPVPVPGVDPGANYENWPQRVNCLTNPGNPVCTYQVYYDPTKREFTGWAWNNKVRWLSFSGSTLYNTSSLWKNNYICGGSKCTQISYDTTAGRSRWNTAYTGVWVQGLGGNIFSKKGFGGLSAPPGEVNSDYLIVTGGYGTSQLASLGPWSGACDDKNNRSPCLGVGRKKYDPLSVANPGTARQGSLAVALPQYSQAVNRLAIKHSTLGTLNTAALFPKDAITNDGKNIFGNRVVRVTGEVGLQVAPLGRSIFYYEGDLTLGSDADTVKRIISDAGVGQSGAATVVVKGNIIIRRPIGYGNQQISQFTQLGSISWIALKRDHADTQLSSKNGIPLPLWNEGGNIVIDDCLQSDLRDSDSINNSRQMSRVAGVFFAENTLATGTGHGGVGVGECGTLYVEYGTADSSGSKSKLYYDVPLEIDGIIVAKNILFQRVYRGGGNGVASETIKNTGRYLVNPPPGLAEFAKSLPLW